MKKWVDVKVVPCRSITEIEEAARRLAAEGFEIVGAPEQQGATCLIGQVTEDIEDGEYARRSRLREQIWEHEERLSRAKGPWKQAKADYLETKKKYDEARAIATANIVTHPDFPAVAYTLDIPGGSGARETEEQVKKYQEPYRQIMDTLAPDVDEKLRTMTQCEEQVNVLEQELSRLRMALLDPNSE